MSIYDMLLSNAMLGEGGGGGGGGSSPFHTATVTLTADRYAQLNSIQSAETWTYPSMFYTPLYNSDLGELCWGFDFNATAGATNSTLQVESVLFYVGDSVEVGVYGDVVSVSGDASYDAETYTFTIWGDCAITLHSID